MICGSRQLRASTGWAAVFVQEGPRAGGGALVAGRAEVELPYTDVSQPQEVGRGRKQPCIY